MCNLLNVNQNNHCSWLIPLIIINDKFVGVCFTIALNSRCMCGNFLLGLIDRLQIVWVCLCKEMISVNYQKIRSFQPFKSSPFHIHILCKTKVSLTFLIISEESLFSTSLSYMHLHITILNITDCIAHIFLFFASHHLDYLV